MLTVESKDLSFIPRVHMVEGENSLGRLFSDLQRRAVAPRSTHLHTQKE